MSQPTPVALTPIQTQQKATSASASVSGLLQRKCACGQHTVAGGECEECRKKREGMLQRAAINAAPTNGVPSIVHDVLSSPGQPLDTGTRAFMEPRFGFDFSRVRVHTDARAAASAHAVNALAYTVGRNVVFGTGQYVPGTSSGRRLLAHELTHVVQQRRASPSAQGGTGLVIDPSPEQEAEAQSAAYAPYSSQAIIAGPRRLALQRAPAGSPVVTLPTVNPDTIPTSWLKTPLPQSGGQDVYVYRGVAQNAANRVGQVVGEGEIGGVLSRNMDAAQDAIFNQVGRDPVLAGPESGGVIRVRIPADVWDELVKTNSISERGNYPGFSRQLQSTEIRVNSPEAARVINGLPKDVVPPDPYYDFRPGAVRPAKPQAAERPQGKSPGASAEGTQPAPPERTTQPPAAGKAPAPGEKPGTAGATGAGGGGELPVEAQFKVLSSTQQADGGIISEVEVFLTKGLDQLNAQLEAHGAPKLASRIVIRFTQNAEGALVSAESVTGESAALAETLARQAIATLPEAAAAEGAAGTVTGAVRGASPWAKGVGVAGLVVFLGITYYQYKKATPEQRPRVLVTAGGSFAGAAATSYLICNLLLGIETFGWSLLICGFVAGIPGGLAGGAIAGNIYDEARATPLMRALNDLQSRSLNVRKLFYAMIAQSGASGGLAITEQFVRSFVAIVPDNLGNDELATLVGRLGSVGPSDTLESILTGLSRAIDQLPRRRPIVLPPVLDITDIPGARDPWHINPLGGGRLRILPPLKQPSSTVSPGQTEQTPQTRTVLEYDFNLL